MPQAGFSKPVGDSVAKVDDEVAVGEDIEFQRKWWKFEHAVWILFTLILLLTIAGAFGRGPLAKAEVRTQDGSIDVKYDRVQRTGTPSIVTVKFGPAAIKDGQIELTVGESMVKELGAQRVVPAPEHTVIGNGSLTYNFLASGSQSSVEFALEPTGPGRRHLTLHVLGMEELNLDIFVMP